MVQQQQQQQQQQQRQRVVGRLFIFIIKFIVVFKLFLHAQPV
jgi:hypothetical protein